MVTFKTKIEVKNIINQWKVQGLKIGFIPTMGYLHEGHISLVEAAKKNNDKVVVSIFVNPIQFGPKEDLASYPRDLERDERLCEEAGVDLIFAPTASEMYFDDRSTYVNVEGLTNFLCGAMRPGHFQGVCTVVSKLFNIVNPHRAYFGEKDAQQLAVIRRMVRDLDIDVEVIGCPIIREVDGLAKSSRNTYLRGEERKASLVLNRSLNLAREALKNDERDAALIKGIIRDEIAKEAMATINYIEVVDSNTLAPVDKIQSSILVAIAVYIGKTKLIDNFTFEI